MRTFDASEFYRATKQLRNVISVIERLEKFGMTPTDKIGDGDGPIIRNMLEEAQPHFDVLGARVSAITATEILDSMAECNYEKLHRQLEELDNVLRRELKLVQLLVLQSGEQSYFDPPEPLFGYDVEIYFPTVSYELEEAAKCLALGRYTAAVFHLMRLLEIAFAALRKCLNIPDPVKATERNWGKMLDAIKAERDARSNRADGWTRPGDKALFGEIHASLDAVRTAWRNSTMHVENKYTAEEAEHIFGAVRGLMRKIATRMDESGLPTADDSTDDSQPVFYFEDEQVAPPAPLTALEGPAD